MEQNETLQEQIHLYMREPLTCDPRGYGYVVRRTGQRQLSEHTHISYLEKGNGYFTINNKRWEIHAGDLFLTPPNVSSIQCADENDELHLHWVGFKTNFNTTIFASAPVIYAPEAKAIFQSISQYDSWDKNITFKLSTDIHRLLRLYIDRDSFSQKNNDIKNHCVQYVCDMIHINYAQNIQFSELAEQLYVHKSYLPTIFKKKIGISPRQYLTAYRIYRAALLLLEHPRTSTGQVAEAVGYSDVSNFRKAFSAHLHIPLSSFHHLTNDEKLERMKLLCREYHLPDPPQEN